MSYPLLTSKIIQYALREEENVAMLFFSTEVALKRQLFNVNNIKHIYFVQKVHGPPNVLKFRSLVFDLLSILHLAFPVHFTSIISLTEISIEIVLSAAGAWKLHITWFRDFIFHLCELSNLVTITLPSICVIFVWTLFQKMEVNIAKHVIVLLVQGCTCQKSIHMSAS